jgi:hypothetical protein
MPRKELKLLARDLGFFVTGRADCKPADWQCDRWLYPVDWSFQLDRPGDYFAPFDENGLPMREIDGKIPLTHLPSRIAAYGLANWNHSRGRTAPRQKQRFLDCASWFAAQSEGAFRYQFPLIGLTAGWLSCIGQGEGVSVLVRAFIETQDAAFAEAATAATAWLHRRVDDDGLLDLLPDGSPFFEEYPRTEYRHVLNGCLYALTGLADAAAAGLDPNGAHVHLCESVLAGIEQNHARWEVGDWTTYDFQSDAMRADGKPPNPNTLTYQTVQWILLDFLAQEFDRPKLAAIAGRWRQAAARIGDRTSALVGKVRYRLDHGYKR